TRNVAAFALDGSAGAGPFTILYENVGHPNGGAGMERQKGITELRIKPANALGQSIDTWKMSIVDSTENRPEVATEFDDSKWKALKVTGGEGAMHRENTVAVYRATFDAPPTDEKAGPLRLVFGMIDDHGWIYLNGEKIG